MFEVAKQYEFGGLHIFFLARRYFFMIDRGVSLGFAILRPYRLVICLIKICNDIISSQFHIFLSQPTLM